MATISHALQESALGMNFVCQKPGNDFLPQFDKAHRVRISESKGK
jgi:hypothetical protein